MKKEKLTRKIYTVETFRSKENKNNFDHGDYLGENFKRAIIIRDNKMNEEIDELNSLNYLKTDTSDIILRCYKVPSDFDIDENDLDENYLLYTTVKTVKRGA